MVLIASDLVWMSAVFIISLSLLLYFLSRPKESVTTNHHVNETGIDESDRSESGLDYSGPGESGDDDCGLDECDIDGCDPDGCATDDCDSDGCDTGGSGGSFQAARSGRNRPAAAADCGRPADWRGGRARQICLRQQGRTGSSGRFHPTTRSRLFH